MADVGKIRKEFRRAVALACAGGIWLTGTVANAGFIRVVGEDFSADRMHTVRDGEGILAEADNRGADVAAGDNSAEALGVRIKPGVNAMLWGGAIPVCANAWGGTTDDGKSNATARGVYNSGTSTTIEGNVALQANAWGGTALSANTTASATAVANGIYVLNDRTTTIHGNAAIQANAWGGTARGNDSMGMVHASANVYGIELDLGSTTTIEGNATIQANAWGGTSANSGTAQAEADAYGIKGGVGAKTIIHGNAVIQANAWSGTSTSTATANAFSVASAYGIQVVGGTVKLMGDAQIEAYAVGGTENGTRARGRAYALYASDSGGSIEMNQVGGHSVRLTGDVYVMNGASININLDTEDSYLRGNVLYGSSGSGQSIIFVVANGAVWQPVYDNRNGTWDNLVDVGADYSAAKNRIEYISLGSGGLIDLTWDDLRRETARTLTIGRFDGSDGIVRLNTNLQNDPAFAGDKIIVEANYPGATMGVAVGRDPVYQKGWGTYTGSYEVLSGLTSPIHGVTSENGAARYEPTMQGNKLVALTVTPSSNVKAAAGAAEAGMLLGMGMGNHLEKRLGELRQTAGAQGVWTRVWRGDLKNEAYGKISTDYKGISIGYDNAREENGGTGWLGLAVSYADGDISLPGGGGTAKAYDLSLYKTWLGKHGHYYDLIARYGRMQDEYHTTDISRHCSEADYAANMLRISAEYGYRKELNSGWYVQPQAEVVWQSQGSTGYTASSGMEVEQDRINSFTGRLGIGVGKQLDNGTNIYGSVSAVHEFDGKVALHTDGLPYSQRYDGTWYEVVVGTTFKLDRMVDGYASVEKLFGGDVSSSWQVNAGLRYSF